MMKFLVPMLLICNLAFAGVSVCSDGNGGVRNFTLRGNPIQGCEYYDGGAEYDATKAVLKSVPQKYIKVSGRSVTEMNTVEKAAVDILEGQAEQAAKEARYARLEVTQEEALVALVQVINVRLPAGQKITKQELIDRIKANR